jgi:hypothetical protein
MMDNRGSEFEPNWMSGAPRADVLGCGSLDLMEP